MSEDTIDQPVVDDALSPATGVVHAPELDPADLPLELDDSQPEEDPEEELEFEGKKAKLPKSLKIALEQGILRQADYTRKTQEAAEIKRAGEALQQQARQQAESHAAFLDDVASIKSLERQLAPYHAEGQPIDWQALRAFDAANGTTHVQDAQALQQQVQQAHGTLGQKMQQRKQDQERETANLIQQRDAELQRDIPGWSPELRGKLEERAVKAGFSKAEFDNSDGRAVRILHRLSVLEAFHAKHTKAAQVAAVAEIVPAATVRGASPAPKIGLSDELPGDEWLKRRNAQLKRK